MRAVTAAVTRIVVAASIALACIAGTASLANAEPTGRATNSNKGSMYGMPQTDGTVKGKNGDMMKITETDDSGAVTSFYAYCIEASVMIGINKDYIETGWDGASDANSFTMNAPKVAWILNNSYPTVDVATLATESGVTDLTNLDAITATQFAIWNLTDPSIAGGNLFPSPTTVPGDTATYPRSAAIQTLMNWLLANVSDSPEPPPSLAITPGTSNVPQSHTSGPFTIDTTSTQPVTLTVDDGAVVVDGQGTPVTAGLHDGDTFYLDTTNVPVGDTATVTATAANVVIETGRVLVTALDPDTYQNLVVASDDTIGNAVADATVTVTAGSTPTPSPSTPAPTSTAPTATASTTTAATTPASTQSAAVAPATGTMPNTGATAGALGATATVLVLGGLAIVTLVRRAKV